MKSKTHAKINRHLKPPRIMRYRQLMVFALGLGGSAVGCGAPKLHGFFSESAGPLIFAHRGGGGVAPEATIPAMLGARERNPNVIVEFDLHRTLDGQIVVIHDSGIERTTGGKGQVADLTWAEIKDLDAGFCATPRKGNGTADLGHCGSSDDPTMFPYRGSGYRIPTFRAVLDALPRDARLSIELKVGGIEKEVATMLKEDDRLPFVIVGSEWDSIAVRLRAALPQVPHYIPTGAGKCFATAKLGLDYAACPQYDAVAAPMTAGGFNMVTKGMIKAAHEQGMAMTYFTANDEADIERVLRAGADGLFTDYPDRAATVLKMLRDEGMIP